MKFTQISEIVSTLSDPIDFNFSLTSDYDIWF